MKNHVLSVGLLLIISSAGNLFAQNKTLGVGAATPNPNAALHVESPTGNQGFIMPRLTTAQRTDPAFTSSLASSSARGLMVFDNDLHEFYMWNDTAWVSLVLSTGVSPIEVKGTSDFSLITASVTTGPINALSGISSSSDPGSYAVLGQNNFSGPGGVFFSKEGTGLMGQTQSDVGGALAPVGVYGESTGTGSSAAAFRINNAANTFSAIFVETNGTGSAGMFQQTNTEVWSPALTARTDGQGAAISGVSTTTSVNANAAEFVVENTSNPRSAVMATTQGTGFAINATHSGASGDAIYAEHQGSGNGSAGNFRISNAANGASALYAATNAPSGTSIGASNDANGIALAIWAGGMKITTNEVTTTSITTRAAAYRITTGGTSFTLDFGPIDGEVFMIYNETGQAITVGGILIPNNEGRTLIVFPGGVIRGL